MTYLIEFRTSKFDPAAEPPNRINPIAGHSILKWLREHVIPDATEPDCEDWGWYTELDFEGSGYLVGAICFAPDEPSTDPVHDWMLQIHKQRSLTDKILGRNTLQPNDRLVAKIAAALRADPAFLGVEEHADR